MADRSGDTPYSNFNYLVEVGGVIIGGFSEVSGLTAEVNAGDYRDGNPVLEVGSRHPGVKKRLRITLRRGLTRSKKLLDWCQAAFKGEQKPVSGSIVLSDEARQVKLCWRFSNAVPVKYQGPDLKATGNEVRIETLELTCEGLSLDRK